MSWLEVHGRDVVITIEPRPAYCDRGNFIAKIGPSPDASPLALLELGLDEQDGWPRYYFDLERAKLEVEAWLRKRRQVGADHEWKAMTI